MRNTFWDFDGFERPNGRMPLVYVCFKDYDETIPNKIIAFEKESIANTFGEYLAKCGKKQLRLAETEKYAHVTFFFNGGVEDPNVDEFRLLVNSPKDVATYDLKPEMSAPEVGMDLVEAIKSDKYDEQRNNINSLLHELKQKIIGNEELNKLNEQLIKLSSKINYKKEKNTILDIKYYI